MKLRLMLCLLLAASLASPLAAQNKQLSTEIVIVGGGGSGLSAAVEALEGGAKIVLLEKAPTLGGNTQWVEGMAAIDSEMMKRDQVLFTADMAYQRMMEYGHWKNNAALVRRFTLESGKNIEWAQAHGTKFERVATAIPGNPYRVWHLFDKHLGSAMTKAFAKIVSEYEAKGMAKVMTATAGEDLIMKDGRVSAVIARDVKTGEKIRIDCKAAILAAGGFINNREWVAKYGGVKVYTVLGLDTMTGDGIHMGMTAGGATEGMSTMQASGPIIAVSSGFELMKYTAAAATSREPFLWVGPGGRRFTDESCNTNWVYGSNAVIRMNSVTYHVFDDAMRQKWISQGLQMAFSEVVPLGTKLPKFDEDFNELLGKGVTFKADTIEELAKKTGMDVAALKETIESYNKAYADKYDAEFGKDPKWLHPIAKAPFYAFKLAPYMLGTIGGLRVDSRLRVVNDRDVAIPGLYATGRDAGGFYGDSYDYIVEGSTMGFAVFSGRDAAQDALVYIKK